MQFKQIITQKNSGRSIRLILFATAIVLSVVGVLIAEGAKQRDFTGQINVNICRKTADGKWEVVDQIKTNASFSASVLQLASGGEVKTDHVWNGRTAKGRQASVRLGGAGKSKFNMETGQLELRDMPFDVTIDGKKDRFSVNLTTEQVSTPIGDFSGKRAQINGRTARLSMVGTSAPKKSNIVVLEEPVAEGKSRKTQGALEQAAEQRTGSKPGSSRTTLVSEVVAVVKGEGQLTAK